MSHVKIRNSSIPPHPPFVKYSVQTHGARQTSYPACYPPCTHCCLRHHSRHQRTEQKRLWPLFLFPVHRSSNKSARESTKPGRAGSPLSCPPRGIMQHGRNPDFIRSHRFLLHNLAVHHFIKDVAFYGQRRCRCICCHRCLQLAVVLMIRSFFARFGPPNKL